jgi:retron-type reverse transcriptase
MRQMTEILQALFPESARLSKGSQYVQRIIEQLEASSPENRWIYRGDIQQFYDAIPRDQLLAVLAERIKLPRLLSLIKHAINTPTVPTNAKRCEYHQHRRDKGVPQGLSISNLLANLYLHSLDQEVQAIKQVSY